MVKGIAGACVYARESRRARKRKRSEPAIRGTQAIVGVYEPRQEIFRTGSPKAALLDPVATCSIGEKCAVMIWGTRCQSVARIWRYIREWLLHHFSLGIKGLHS
ncbi:MAG: hypothetical protein DMF14_12005 [Verrucomicrobia bacterium]|nr:MAG: hypothetical protein DMF14_12005 [Verrucomicrobiota bacterium]